MKYKKLYKILLVIFVAAVLLYIIMGLKKGKNVDYRVETRADGEGMVFNSFNDDNKKVLELKCRTAQKGEGDRMYMTGIEGLIYKKGRMNKDIRVYADQGYTENNLYNFFIEQNARLVSTDFTIRSQSFFMKDRAEMNTTTKVEYFTKSINGIANGGMALYLNINTLNFFDTSGTYRQGKIGFDFQTQKLWFIDKDKMMVLENDAIIRDDKSILRSDWVTMKFTDDLKEIKETSSQKNSYLYYQDKAKQEIKEIKSDNIRCLYDDQGRLTTLSVYNRGEILLKDRDNKTNIASELVDMDFDGPTGNATKAKISKRGVVENTGSTRFRVVANVIDLDYDHEGKLRTCIGTGKVVFVVEKYDGNADKVTYNINKHTMRIEGENSRILSKTNNFYSSLFFVETEKKILSTDKNVKSIIYMENENALFSKDAIFINAQKVTVLEKEKKITYEQNVSLTQSDVKLEAMKLEINGNNDIIATGKVSLNFKSENKMVSLKGERLLYDSKAKTIDLQNQAAIKSGDNVLQAVHIIISFNKDNEIQSINGQQKVNFLKEDLSGSSQRVEWDYKKDTMVFRGSPRIARSGGGKTTGEILKIELNTGRITILSNDSERSETVIQ